MTPYEIFECLVICLSVLFIITDFFLKKYKIYKFLKAKLITKYALDANVFNLNHTYQYKHFIQILNYMIKNTYTFFKFSIILSILFFILYKSLALFILPAALLFLLAIIVIISKKVSLKEYINSEMIIALDAYQPDCVFYFTAPSENFLYHINMWLPYLKETKLKFYIMIREEMHLKELMDLADDVPIVVAPSLTAMERHLPSSVKLAFYANNGTKNTHLVRFNNIQHIQLLHGDSEKPPSFNPVSKMYDKLFVSGQRAIDRYAENRVYIDKNNFEIIGRPQISNINIFTPTLKKNGSYTVLFAPTWVGFHEDTKFSSLFYIYDTIKYLITSKTNVKIILRLHPITDRNDKKTSEYLKKIDALLNISKDEHILCSNRDIIDDFNESDCLITDVSSVPIDYLYSEKPIVHIDVNALSNYFETDKRYEQYSKCVYMIDADYNNVEEVFKHVFENDTLLESRKKVKSYYHGSFAKPLDEVFTSTVNRLYQEQLQNSDKE